MNAFRYRPLLICTLLFFYFDAAQAQQTTAPKPVTVVKKTVTVPAPATGTAIANGIKLQVKGMLVKEAFLVFNDGARVPETNMIDLSQEVSLRLILSKGFKEIKGKVFPGGSEKIMISSGEVILESNDLYTAYDSVGVSPVDAKYITLKAVITEIKDKKNNVIVSFRVWDKKSTLNEINGSYIIHIK